MLVVCGHGPRAGMAAWGVSGGAGGVGVSSQRGVSLRAGRRGGRGRWAGGGRRRWCGAGRGGGGLLLLCRGGGGSGGRVGAVGGPALAVLLVLDLLEVLLPRSHLGVLQLLHVEGLTVGQELLPLILQSLSLSVHNGFQFFKVT